MSTAGKGGDALGRAARIRASAAERAPQQRGDYEALQDDALLTRINLSTADWLLACRAIARFTMLRQHGCTGRSCAHQDHTGHRRDRDEALAMLDPTGGRDTRKDGYGLRRSKHKSKPGVPAA
jgi:hypothetical protein